MSKDLERVGPAFEPHGISDLTAHVLSQASPSSVGCNCVQCLLPEITSGEFLLIFRFSLSRFFFHFCQHLCPESNEMPPHLFPLPIPASERQLFSSFRVPVTPYLCPYFWRPCLACWLFHANFCVTYCICHCGGCRLSSTPRILSVGSPPPLFTNLLQQYLWLC